MKEIAKRYIKDTDITKEEWIELLQCAEDPDTVQGLAQEAVRIRAHPGKT